METPMNDNDESLEPTPEDLGLALCEGCKAYVDFSCCGCGDPMEGHDNILTCGHHPVPLGCNCFRVRKEND